MRRVLIFSIAYEPLVGGAEVAVRNITDRISDCHFDMLTLRFSRSHKPIDKIGNVTVHRLGPWLGGKADKIIYIFAASWKASRLHKAEPYGLAWAIMANYTGLAALFFKLMTGRPYLLTLQEGDPTEEIEKKVKFIRPLWRMIFRRADHVQAISHFLASWAKRNGAIYPVTVIPNGIDREVFDYKKFPAKDRGHEETIITVSRLVKKNAVGDIISSLTFLPANIKLLIIGDGEERVALEVLAKNLGVQARVEFVGAVPHAQTAKYLAMADVFIRPSLSEGFGNAFIEAMGMKVPVVATAVGGITDFLRDGETGLFCRVRDPKSIAETVTRILADENLRQVITANAYQLLDTYNWPAISERMKSEVISPLLPK